MTIAQFKKAYKLLRKLGWKVSPPGPHGQRKVRLGNSKRNFGCHDPVTAVATATTSFRLHGILSEGAFFRAARAIGLKPLDASVVLVCSDDSVQKLRRNEGEYAVELRRFFLDALPNSSARR